jgi:hypothetical protein
VPLDGRGVFVGDCGVFGQYEYSRVRENIILREWIKDCRTTYLYHKDTLATVIEVEEAVDLPLMGLKRTEEATAQMYPGRLDSNKLCAKR